ncbi:MAG: molybdate ABC transporter substrate-binding protein [Xanthobacteraceae bacterium]|nr:molybdate ABC transporter substrate-binding protein [Xanthobacteraceae bacterium]
MKKQTVFCAILLALFSSLSATGTMAGAIEVFHADSLAGPLKAMKKAFEEKNKDVTINLTPGTSKQLAERILKGDTVDVFASSSPAVVDQDLMNKKITGTDRDAASWYVIFSSNEMVVITAKGNPLGIRQIADLAKPDVKFLRITAEKDLATGRTVDFLKKAAALEGNPDVAQKIIDASAGDPSKATSVPETVRAVKEGIAGAGVVYYSAAVAAKNDVEIIRFPASVNLSEAIRNAALVPGTAANTKEAKDFVRFLVTPEAQAILKDSGQPPLIPAIWKGEAPSDVKG